MGRIGNYSVHVPLAEVSVRSAPPCGAEGGKDKGEWKDGDHGC